MSTFVPSLSIHLLLLCLSIRLFPFSCEWAGGGANGARGTVLLREGLQDDVRETKAPLGVCNRAQGEAAPAWQREELDYRQSSCGMAKGDPRVEWPWHGLVLSRAMRTYWGVASTAGTVSMRGVHCPAIPDRMKRKTVSVQVSFVFQGVRNNARSFRKVSCSYNSVKQFFLMQW